MNYFACIYSDLPYTPRMFIALRTSSKQFLLPYSEWYFTLTSFINLWLEFWLCF